MPVELSITKASIRQHLTQVDFDSLDSLRSFASLLNDSCSRDIANTCVLASSLTLSETFRFFGYTNEIRTIYGAEKPIICEELIANVPANVTASKSFSRLTESLETAGRAWSTNAETARHLFLERVVTTALARVRRKTTITPLHGVHDITLSCCVRGPPGPLLVVTSHCDIAVGFKTVGLQGEGQSSLDTVLVVVKVRVELALESALPELLAYMGTVQAMRKQKGDVDRTLHGLCSDGFNYTFVLLNTEQKVSRSRVFSLLDGGLPEIYSYLMNVLWAAEKTAPSTSATNVEVGVASDTVQSGYSVVQPFEESEESGEDLIIDPPMANLTHSA